jgi:hypothetical protein
MLAAMSERNKIKRPIKYTLSFVAIYVKNRGRLANDIYHQWLLRQYRAHGSAHSAAFYSGRTASSPGPFPARHTSTPQETAQTVPSVSQSQIQYKKYLPHQTLEQQLSLRT